MQGYALVDGVQRYLPTSRGFDHFHGTPATHCESCGGWPPEPVFLDDDIVGRLDCELPLARPTTLSVPSPPLSSPHAAVTLPVPTDTWFHNMGTSNLTQSYAAFGGDFIARAAAAHKPWLLYAAFDNTHDGLYYNRNFSRASRRGPIGDATMELDWAVGVLMAAVRGHGQASGTTVWFAGVSDTLVAG